MKKKVKFNLEAGARYGSFMSVGELLNIEVPRLKNTMKAQFLPQWTGYDRSDVESILDKRFILTDLSLSDINSEDIRGVAKFSKTMMKAATEQPEEMLKITTAFGKRGNREDREKVLERAEKLGLYSPDDSEPTALIGVILLVGAAILLAGCCNHTDRDCGDDGNSGSGGTDGDPK
ncbi:MAG: hypothetical protein V3U75_05255 [Methylococcaceae bacterium]